MLFRSKQILNVFPRPITGTVKNVELSHSKIRLCLVQNARVEEILPSGKTIRLNFLNYDKKLSEDDVIIDHGVVNQPIKDSDEKFNVEPEVKYNSTEDITEPVIEPTVEPAVEEVVIEPAVEEVVIEPAVEEVVIEPAVEEAVIEEAVEEVVIEPTVEEAVSPQQNRNQQKYKKK